MKKFKFKIRGNSYDVEIKSFEHDVAEIEVNGSIYQVEVEIIKSKRSIKTPRLVRARVPAPNQNEKAIQKSEDFSVKAPLPGTIIKISVREGDTVKAGDTLLLMEAMKMENNVLAEKNGTITKLHISEGDTVLQNDTLITIS